MALFKKNANEAAYVGGRKHWADVIKNSGDGDLLIWRQPEEDFNTNSTLIVMPGEEAIFIKGGTIEHTFENGTYKLSTENYPFISRLRTMFTGGISTFNCVVYFVRKADSRELLWGTDSPIQVRDKAWGVRTDARVRGAYKLRIDNPTVFLEKLIGNNIPYQRQDDIFQYFENELAGKIKTAVSSFLNSWQNELIGMDAYLTELSAQIHPYINETVSDYGLKCVSFSLSGLDIDVTKYDQMDEAQMAKIAKLRNAEGDKGVMDILSENWGKQQAANILGTLAQNPGAGGIAATGAGLGMGFAAGSVFGSMADQMFAPMNGAIKQEDQSYGMPSSSRFEQVNEDEQSSSEDSFEVLSTLKRMLDAGLIEQTEYDAKKTEIMSRM